MTELMAISAMSIEYSAILLTLLDTSSAAMAVLSSISSSRSTISLDLRTRSSPRSMQALAATMSLPDQVATESVNRETTSLPMERILASTTVASPLMMVLMLEASRTAWSPMRSMDLLMVPHLDISQRSMPILLEMVMSFWWMLTWRDISQSRRSTSLSLSDIESRAEMSFSSRASRMSLSMFLTSTFILSTDLAGLISPWSMRSLMRILSSLSSRISSPMAVWVNEDAVLVTMLGSSPLDRSSMAS